MITEQLSQSLSFAGTELDPVSQGVATVNTGGVDMTKFERVLFVIMVGAVGGAGTVDAKLRSSATVNGTYADISGASITQITASNKIATLEIKSTQMPSGQPFCRMDVTVGGNAVLIAALAVGGEAHQKPASAQDIAAVTQRKVV
jgi:hypothetical protein